MSLFDKGAVKAGDILYIKPIPNTTAKKDLEGKWEVINVKENNFYGQDIMIRVKPLFKLDDAGDTWGLTTDNLPYFDIELEKDYQKRKKLKSEVKEWLK